MEENVIQINGGKTINVDVSVKNIMYVKEDMFGILVHVFGKVIMCDKVIESYYEDAGVKSNDATKIIPTNFNVKYSWENNWYNKTGITCKRSYILLTFLLIIITLLIDISI